MMERIIFVLLTITMQLTVYAQCPTRSYTPEWDWRGPSKYTFVTKDTNQPIKTLDSPWFYAKDDNPNVEEFRSQYPKDYEPDDGWVLVRRDFGTTDSPTDNPYFILYNKYSGILRIFVAVTTVFGQNNSAVITLSSVKPNKSVIVKTAILENHTINSYRSALDDFDNQVPEIVVPNVYSNDLPFWLHADFTMNYDPCTCNNQSGLFFKAELITTANLVFTANGKVVQDIDATGNGNIRQSLARIGQSTVDAGNSFFNTAKSGVETIKQIFPKITEKSGLKRLESIIPGLSAAVGVVDFLSGLSGTTASQPMSFDINLKATGTLTTSFSYKTLTLQNPGSANLTLVPPTRLNYNNTMGIFNLLETPSVSVSNIKGISREIHREVIYSKCKLNAPISYVVNPEPGFELDRSTIKIALVFEAPTVPDYDGVVLFNSNLVDEGNSNGKQIVRSEFIPISCATNLSTYFGVASGGVKPEIYLKILGTFVKGNKTSIYVSKYKVNVIDDHTKFFISAFWPSSLKNIPKDISYSLSIHHSYGVDGKDAWNSITFNSSDGATFYNIPQNTYTTGNSIIVNDHVVIGPNTTLKVGTPNGCESTITQGNPSVICNSTTNTYYKKSHGFVREHSKTANDLNTKENEKSTFAFYPNPAKYSVKFSYYLKEDSQVSLSILNINGQTIATPIHDFQTGGPHEFIFDTSFIPSGLYFIHFVSNGLDRREKLVIVK